MLKPKKMNSYNDGIISVYDEIIKETDFSAKKNVKTLDDLIFVKKLCFKEESRRVQDFEFAESVGRKLTFKLKTPLVDGIKINQKVIIKNCLYDIFQLDQDRSNQELYFYLEEVRKIEK